MELETMRERFRFVVIDEIHQLIAEDDIDQGTKDSYHDMVQKVKESETMGQMMIPLVEDGWNIRDVMFYVLEAAIPTSSPTLRPEVHDMPQQWEL